MTIPFANIPQNLRVPLFYAELDNSKANSNSNSQRTLIIGQKTDDGTLDSNVPTLSRGVIDTRAGGGPGSVLTNMLAAYRQNDSLGEVWLLTVRDNPAGVAAVGTLTFTGPTTGAGTLALYVGGQLASIPIASGQTGTQIGVTVAAAINAAIDLPVTAAAAAGVVTVTAKNKGEVGNECDLRTNYLGAAGGEKLPAGLGITIVAMTGGATNPVLTTALAGLQDMPFDFIVSPYTDATSIAAIASLLNDTTGRWAWSQQIYGHHFIAKRGTPGSAATFGNGLNDQHLTVLGFNDSPTPNYIWAAAVTGAAAPSIRQDPGRPLQTLAVKGVLAPPVQSRWPLLQRNTLLYDGISTFTVDGTGAVAIENLITTYQLNPQGYTDDSYLEVETLFLLAFVLRRLRAVVAEKFGRMKLAINGTRALPGTNVVTPNTIRAELIAAYQTLEGEGYVQNSEAFTAAIVVEKSATVPNRVDVLYPAILINQLRVFATLLQFRQA